MRKLHTLMLLLGVGFLAGLVWKVGFQELWGQLRALRWGLGLLILTEGVANVLHTAGWRCCLRSGDRRLPLHRLFRMSMAGFAINYLTPTASLGGEVSKAALLSSQHSGVDAASSVLMDKLCTAVAHLLLVFAGAFLVLTRVDLAWPLRAGMIASTALLALGILGFFLIQRHGKLGALARRLASRKVGGRSLEKLTEQCSEVDERLKAYYRNSPVDLLLSVTWHVAGHAMAVVQTWLFFHLLQRPVSVAGVVCAGALCLWFDLLTFAMPLNLGTLEGSRMLVLRQLGYSAVQGMTYGLALRLAQLFWAVYGLACYGGFLWRRRGSEPRRARLDAPTSLQPPP